MSNTKRKLSLLIGGVTLFLVLSTTIKMLYLNTYGISTKGIVEEVYSYGSKGRYACRYNFRLGEEKYQGNEVYENLSEGDSIVIIYSPLYPNINTLEKKLIDNRYRTKQTAGSTSEEE